MEKLTERELEDFIVENLCYALEDYCHSPCLIGRQVILPHGRVDILAFSYGHLLPIELKARTLKEEDVGQVLRYTHDLKILLRDLKDRFNETGNPQSISGSAATKEWRDCFHHTRVQPVLVGPRADDSVLSSAFGARIDVIIFSIDRNTVITFKHAVEFQKPIKAPSLGNRRESILQKAMMNHCVGFGNDRLEYLVRHDLFREVFLNAGQNPRQKD